MEYAPFFKPVEIDSLGLDFQALHPDQLGRNVLFFNPEESIDIAEAEMAIVGVPESRNSYRNASCFMAPDEIRSQFYQLYRWKKDVRIVDMGNLHIGTTPEDTYEALSDIVADMLENNVIPIILGGGNDLAFANYRGYEKIERVTNVVSVDSCFDLGDENQPIRSDAYLSKMVLQQPNFLLNYANVGFQSYMNSPETTKMMEELYFETYRVGMLRSNLEEAEPIIRNAEMLSIDISAVRRPDAPGCPHASSNGFYGEEICQIAKYAGINDKLTSIGIYEYDPTLDYSNQTSQLIAHILWCFVEGYVNRQNDVQFKNSQDYLQYHISVSGALDEMVFYKSLKTGRWWMLIPIINMQNDRIQHYFLPCSKHDYDMACEDRIPERWWKAYNKLNH